MAEEKGNPIEEDGFKFVDKRKVSDVDDAPVEAVDSPSEVTVDADADEAVAEAAAEDVTAEDGPTGEDGVFGIVSYAIGLMSMSAWQYLGLIADPNTGKAKRDLKQARIAIDCVGGMVEALDKNPGVADPKTTGDLKRVLNDLRLNFVTQSNMPDSSN